MNPTPEKDGDPADENYFSETYVWNINGHQLNDEGFPIIADIAYAKGKNFLNIFNRKNYDLKIQS